jgi:hypothetical protein
MASNFAKLLELLGRGIIGPFGRLNNTAHNESHVLAINLVDPSRHRSPRMVAGYGS